MQIEEKIRLINQGLILFKNGNYKEAGLILSEVSKDLKEKDFRRFPELREVLLLLASALAKMEDFEQAVRLYQIGLRVLKGIKKLACLHDLGACFYNQGKFKEAKGYFEKFFKGLVKRPCYRKEFQKLLCNSIIMWARSEFFSGNCDQAIEILREESLKFGLSENLKIKRLLIQYLVYKGIETSQEKFLEESFRMIDNLFKKELSLEDKAILHALKGQALFEGKISLKKAEKEFEKAEEIASLLRLHSILTSVYAYLSKINIEKGRFHKAKEFLERAFEEEEKHKEKLIEIIYKERMRKLLAVKALILVNFGKIESALKIARDPQLEEEIKEVIKKKRSSLKEALKKKFPTVKEEDFLQNMENFLRIYEKLLDIREEIKNKTGEEKRKLHLKLRDFKLTNAKEIAKRLNLSGMTESELFGMFNAWEEVVKVYIKS